VKEFELDSTESLTAMSMGRKKSFSSLSGSRLTASFILDEPTNGLDIPSKSQFRRLVAGG
jgi:ABC-2 type transport system ATP-binding protein